MSRTLVAAAEALTVRFANEAREALRAAPAGSVAVISDGSIGLGDLAVGSVGLRILPLDVVRFLLEPYAGLDADITKTPPQGFGHLVVFVEGRPGLFFAQVDRGARLDGSRVNVGRA